MASRRNRRSQRQWEPLDVERALGGRSQTQRNGEDWTVQRVRGNDKEYRCPGCSQLIPAHTAHVVAWANDSLFGAQAALDQRRHWHAACWQRAN